jgi:hypothetical protein
MPVAKGVIPSVQGRAKWFLFGGGEIKKLGPLPFGPPPPNFFFSRNQKIFPQNIGDGGRGGDVPKQFSNTKFT